MAAAGHGEEGVFGEKVRAHRLRLAMTQEQLAEVSGTGLRTIRNIETGRIPVPRPSTVRLLADAFGLHGTERDRFHESALLGGEPLGGPGAERPKRAATGAEVLPGGVGDLVPRQLPAPPRMFAGRSREVSLLDEVPDSSTVVIAAIDGMAGVGKTALALHAAHRIADYYPDGQLFIDLHGYTPGMAPIEPTAALDRMLRALGIPGPQVPTDLDERAALYRSRLADQRMLIVLDNAATEAQITPLLPGASGCVVVVTSRNRLAGLDQTCTLSLDTLPVSDAVTLFLKTVGEDRLTGQPSALLAELAELCGRLPLAIRIAAARLRSHPTWHLSHLAERLRDQRHRLAELEAGQRSVTAALDLSYQHLNPNQQRTYRLLGLHPGVEIDAYATAALLNSTLPHAGRMLDHLLDAHLLLEPDAGRYRFHDLTRAHATHIATCDQDEPTRDTAVDRLLDYFRHAASVAADAAYPYEPREHRSQVPPASTPVPELADSATAVGWLDTELPNLIAAAGHATEHSTSHIGHLSSLLHRHLRTRGRYHDAETLHLQALGTARATGDQAGQMDALTGLGHVHRAQSRYQQATGHFEQALQIARATGHRHGEVNALIGFGQVHVRQGRHEQATSHLEQALQIARATGHRAGELDSLTSLGHVHVRQGRYQQGTSHLERALQIARATGHRAGELSALVGLSQIHRWQGRYQQATDHLEQALQIARVTGHRHGELTARAGLGQIHRLQGRYEQATNHLERALQIARATGHRAGELSALSILGKVDLRQGRHGQAANHFRQLLRLAQESSDRNYQFEARQGLGRLHTATGHPDAAITHHNRALALATELGQPDDQARTHDGLAHAHRALNQHDQARSHWQRALHLLTSLGISHTDDEEATTASIRDRLASLDEQRRPE